MGHRALIIIEQEDNPGTYRTRGSHWGASGAKYLGTDYEVAADAGDPHSGVYQSLEDVGRECVDFLFHEAVYLAQPGQPTIAYDTIWWRGARNYVPRPGGIVGVGALVRLKEKSEWERFSGISFNEDTDEMSAMQFHNFIRDSDFVYRVPEWSPIGGHDIRVGEEYRPKTA